jgi:hypothetical protein
MTIRELSTEQRNDWIERIFSRLAAIYGKEFAYKWGESDSEEVSKAWAEALAGFDGDAIRAALKTCFATPKCPNLPEFAAMCRQSMQPRHVLPDVEPVEPVERSKAAAMIGELCSKFQEAGSAKAAFSINGVPITHYKQWTYALILRENDGEMINFDSAKAWREVLGFGEDITAAQALGTWKEIEQ